MIPKICRIPGEMSWLCERMGRLKIPIRREKGALPGALKKYCIHCNACVRRCPVGAIDPVKGKDHPTCHAFVENSKKVFKPRYGCGLCQTGVPCEAENPLHLMD